MTRRLGLAEFYAATLFAVLLVVGALMMAVNVREVGGPAVLTFAAAAVFAIGCAVRFVCGWESEG